MPNYRQAPVLYHNKMDYKSKNYYELPEELMIKIMNDLDGKCGNQLKLMIFLLGQAGNGDFAVAEKTVCDRCGMIQQTYSKARQALIERGWVFVMDGKIFVLPEIIMNGFSYPKGASKEEREKIKKGTISQCVKKIVNKYPKAQCEVVPKGQFEIVPKTQCEVVYNKEETKKENKEVFDLPPLGPNQKEEIITRAFADLICDKEWIEPDLIFISSTGRYFRVRG